MRSWHIASTFPSTSSPTMPWGRRTSCRRQSRLLAEKWSPFSSRGPFASQGCQSRGKRDDESTEAHFAPCIHETMVLQAGKQASMMMVQDYDTFNSSHRFRTRLATKARTFPGNTIDREKVPPKNLELLLGHNHDSTWLKTCAHI